MKKIVPFFITLLTITNFFVQDAILIMEQALMEQTLMIMTQFCQEKIEFGGIKALTIRLKFKNLLQN